MHLTFISLNLPSIFLKYSTDNKQIKFSFYIKNNNVFILFKIILKLIYTMNMNKLKYKYLKHI